MSKSKYTLAVLYCTPDLHMCSSTTLDKSFTNLEKWKSIDYRLMTEESEGEDDDGNLLVRRHRMQWRSSSESFHCKISDWICICFRIEQVDNQVGKTNT